MGKPTPAEIRYKLYFKIVDRTSTVLSSAVPWLGAVLIAYFMRDGIIALAGKQTVAQIGMGFLGDLRVSDGIAVIFGGGGVAYGWRCKKLKDDNIERTGNRIKELETRLDPNRSSSRLTPRGKTRPEDRL